MLLLNVDSLNEFYKYNADLLILDIPWDEGKFDYQRLFDRFEFNSCAVILVDRALHPFQTFYIEACRRWCWMHHGIWIHEGVFTHILGFVNRGETRAICTCSLHTKEITRETNHPEERPVELMEFIIKNFSCGGVVVDPFMGTGASAVAAKNLRAEYVGMEIEKPYFEQAHRRVYG